MSENFEKQVISMLTEQKEELKAFKEYVEEKFTKQEDEMQSMKEEMQSMKDEMQDMKDGMKSMQCEMKDIKEDVDVLKRAVINIEAEVTTKIPALFDAFSANLDKHKQYDEKINNLEATVEEHSIRLDVLELTNARK